MAEGGAEEAMKSQPTFTLPKPKEHGAWGMLYVPLATAVAIVGTLNLRVLVLSLAVTALFLSQRPYGQLLSNPTVWRDRGLRRRNVTWLAVYWSLGTFLFGLLYFYYELRALPAFALLVLPVAAAFTVFLRKNRMRSVSGELAGICGLTLTAPLAHYAATGEVSSAGLTLWGLFLLYFASSVFYVKALVAASLKSRSKDPSEAAPYSRLCGTYHVGLLALLGALVFFDRIPVIGLIAFLPVITRGLWGLRRPQPKLNFARIGWTEVLYSLFFALATALAMRMETLAR